MGEKFIYAQETPTEAEDFGCIVVSDEGDTFTVSVGPSKPCYWEMAAEIQLYDDQARDLVEWLQAWLSEREQCDGT
jgi:hypothetical protein